MRGYFGLGQLSATEKQDILDQHKSLYNGYQTMQPQVSNTQPLYTYDFAGDKDGMVVNNKGEVKKYTNMGINEQVESKEMCEQCGGRMTEGICEQCGGGEMEEGVGKLDDIYDEEDLNPSAGFDYIEGPSNSVDTFEKMHKNLYKEEYEDPDNEDDGFEDLQAGEEIDEQGYTGGGNAPDMDLSNIEPAYDFISDGPMAGGDVYPTEGEMDEQTSSDDRLRYKRRGITYENLLTFIEYEKTQFDMCEDFSDQFEYADNIITSAVDTFFAETTRGEMPSDEFYTEIHDLCKEWYGEDLLSEYVEECEGSDYDDDDLFFEECLDCVDEYETMESAFEDLNEVDISGSQGIYGEMEPPYDFDSEGPGKAGPYQRSSYYEEEDEDEESEEDFELDEDLKESFMEQKNKVMKMMNRMKIIK
jgi:hypothetical protein